MRIGGPLLCALAAVAVAAPATAVAQSAVDEYTLNIPGGSGTNPGDPTAPTSASAAGNKGGGQGGKGGSGKGSGESGTGVTSGTTDSTGLAAAGVNLASLQEGSGQAALPTTSRSAPEVVADSLTNSAMLPILGALALITAGGLWRLLRTRRRTLTGATG